jgi:rubrerythrin
MKRQRRGGRSSSRLSDQQSALGGSTALAADELKKRQRELNLLHALDNDNYGSSASAQQINALAGASGAQEDVADQVVVVGGQRQRKPRKSTKLKQKMASKKRNLDSDAPTEMFLRGAIRFESALQDHESHVPAYVPSYRSSSAQPSAKPPRLFCSVCGYTHAIQGSTLQVYACPRCAMRFCCHNCLETHRDTRCLKWLS